MEKFKPESMEAGPGLDMEKMGKVFQLSGTIALEGGKEVQSDASSERKMEYGTNNGFLSFVTEGGVQYVTRSSSEKEQELMFAGFKNAGMGVPFSNGEKPEAGSSQYDVWERMVQG